MNHKTIMLALVPSVARPGEWYVRTITANGSHGRYIRGMSYSFFRVLHLVASPAYESYIQNNTGFTVERKAPIWQRGL